MNTSKHPGDTVPINNANGSEMPNLPSSFMIGPGSQLDDQDGTLSYMPMPSEMSVYATPHLPEPEDFIGFEAGKAALTSVLAHLEALDAPNGTAIVDLSTLDKANRLFVDQVLGEGEVSIVGGSTHQAQESVLAGVWRVRQTNDKGDLIADLIEVGDFPRTLLNIAFPQARTAVTIPEHFAPNVFNTPALLPEINEYVAKAADESKAHVINLSLLPHTPEDLTTLAQLLGAGELTILSRGYGNCRVTSTGTQNTWWVRYYNSQDTLILNSIEITPLPEIVCAAPEDLGDSAERLREILEVYK